MFLIFRSIFHRMHNHGSGGKEGETLKKLSSKVRIDEGKIENALRRRSVSPWDKKRQSGE